MPHDTDKLPAPFQKIYLRFVALLGVEQAAVEDTEVYSMQNQLQQALDAETDHGRLDDLKEIIQMLKDYFSSTAILPSDNNARALVTFDPGAFRAFLTLIPARKGGQPLDMGEIRRIVNAQEIRHGLNTSVLDQAIRHFLGYHHVIHFLEIATGTLPRRDLTPEIRFHVPVLDKDALLRSEKMDRTLFAELKSLEKGTKAITILWPSNDLVARTVKGDYLLPRQYLPLPFEIGENLIANKSKTQITAMTSGMLVRDQNVIRNIPFYVIQPDASMGTTDIHFNGNILVMGNVSGDLTIHAEDVYILGNLEAASIHAAGDVFIAGGIIGKQKTDIHCDGSLIAQYISDAKVATMANVIVRNTITYSEVTCNGMVEVTMERGAIVGGTISALLGVTAKTIGSDFGTFTRTHVGKDFLSPLRLKKIQEKINLHQQNLQKIEDLKHRLKKARVKLKDLPADKQDIYIGVLKKEEDSKVQLESLARKQKQLNKMLQDFMDATIMILHELHPPAKIQVVDTIRDIEEKLGSVKITYQDGTMVVTKVTPEQG